MPTQAQKVLVFNFPGKMSASSASGLLVKLWMTKSRGGDRGLNIRVPDVKYSLLLNHSLFKAKKLKSSIWNENLHFISSSFDLFPGSFHIRQPLATQYHGPHRARDETGSAIVQGPNR